MKIKKNIQYEILTPSGFKPFHGISKSNGSMGLTLQLSNGGIFRCTSDHRLKTFDGRYIFAIDSVGEILINGLIIETISNEDNNSNYFDILEVDGHEYLSSGIVSHNCEFLGSVATLVDSKYLKDLGFIEPIHILDGNRLRIFETPMDSTEMSEKGYEYLITVDPAMGTMQDYSVCQVWLIKSNTDVTQVAIYESNDIPPKMYVNKVHMLARMYHDAGIIVETMEQAGGVIIHDLQYELNYPNLIHMNEKGLGFNMAHNRKMEACVYLQVYMEKGLLKIVDARTITQMSMFGKRGNTFRALADGNDDLVTSTLSMLFYINSPYFYGNMDDEPIYKKKTVAEEFSGISEVKDEGVRRIMARINEQKEEDYQIPLIKNPNSNFTPNGNFIYSQWKGY